MASNEGDTPIYIANINPQGPVGKSNNVKVSHEISVTSYIILVRSQYNIHYLNYLYLE